MRRRPLLKLAGALIALTLVGVACGGNDDNSDTANRETHGGHATSTTTAPA